MAKEVRMYYPLCKTRIKIRAGRRVISAESEISHIPPISFIMDRLTNATVGYTDEMIIKAVKAKTGVDVTEDEVFKAIKPLMDKGFVANSRGDYVAKTEGPATAVESYKVDSLAKQLAKAAEDSESKGAENQRLAREIDELKAKLAKR